MDMQFAQLISLFRYAENAYITERNYFDSKADDPFTDTAARLEAMTAMTQLDAKLVDLRNKKDSLIAAHGAGTFPSPSPELLTKVHDAAQRLSNALTNAASAKAVVAAAVDFFNVVGAISTA